MTEQQQYHTDAHHPTGDQQSMITPPLSPSSIVVDAALHRTNMSAAAAESKKKDHSKFLIFLRLLMKHLKRSDRITHIQAEALIKKCYQTNISIHNPMFSKLLRRLVGEINWKIAKEYQLQYYLRKMTDEELDSYYNNIKSEMESIGEVGNILSEMKSKKISKRRIEE